MYLKDLKFKEIPIVNGLKLEGIIVTVNKRGILTSVNIGKAFVKNNIFTAIGYGGYNAVTNIADYVKLQKEPSKFQEPIELIDRLALVTTKSWKRQLIKELFKET